MSVLDFEAEAIDINVFDELVNYLYNYPSTPQVGRVCARGAAAERGCAEAAKGGDAELF